MSPPSASDVAASVADVVPLVMRLIRREMRAAASPGRYRCRSCGHCYSSIETPTSTCRVSAEHLGIGLTGASGLVDRLVKQHLLSRETDPNERRRIQLTVTAQGKARLDEASHSTREAIAEQLGELTPDEAATIERAMDILREQFATPL